MLASFGEQREQIERRRTIRGRIDEAGERCDLHEGIGIVRGLSQGAPDSLARQRGEANRERPIPRRAFTDGAREQVEARGFAFAGEALEARRRNDGRGPGCRLEDADELAFSSRSEGSRHPPRFRDGTPIDLVRIGPQVAQPPHDVLASDGAGRTDRALAGGRARIEARGFENRGGIFHIPDVHRCSERLLSHPLVRIGNRSTTLFAIARPYEAPRFGSSPGGIGMALPNEDAWAGKVRLVKDNRG